MQEHETPGRRFQHWSNYRGFVPNHAENKLGTFFAVSHTGTLAVARWRGLRKGHRDAPAAVRSVMTINSVSEMVADARAKIVSLDVEDARRLLEDPKTVFVDLRDSTEIANDGTIPGAIHMPRGNLEFWIDPASRYFKAVFGKECRFTFFCAADLRSTLATATAQDMGLTDVCQITGGFAAWRDAGAPIAAKPRPIEELC